MNSFLQSPNKNNRAAPDESLIINTVYFEQLKDQLLCTICYGLLVEPKMCSVCESAFCSDCISTWMNKNGSCPLKCTYPNFNIKEVHITKKKILDGLKIRCKYGCEVPLLSYFTHITQCEINNKEVNCWNCSQKCKMLNLKVKSENDYLKTGYDMDQYNYTKKDYECKISLLEDKIEELVIEKYKDEEKYELELNAQKERNDKLENEISDIRRISDENTLKMKNEIGVLKYENSNLMEQLSLKDEEKILCEKENVELKIKLTETKLENSKHKISNLADKKVLYEEKISKYSNLIKKISDQLGEKENVDCIENYTKELESLKDQVININNSIEKNTVFRENLHKQDKFQYTKETKINTTFINPKNDNFQFYNGNKTIKVVSGGKWDWLGFFCKDKIINVGIQEFSIKIDTTKDAYFLIGFAVAGTSTAKGLHNTELSWMCDLYDGEFYNAGNHGNYFWEKNTVKLQTGDIISISLDTSLNQLTMKRNGAILGSSLNMKIKDGQNQKLFPCVDMRDVGDQITIV